MGLLDWVPGVGSAAQSASNEESEVPIKQFYLCHHTPDAPVEEWTLLIGPNEGGELDSEFAIYRCTQGHTEIPATTKLYVFRSGHIVSIGADPYQLHLAQFVQTENVEPDSYDGEFVDFPAALTEMAIAEQYNISDHEFKNLLLSIVELEE